MFEESVKTFVNLESMNYMFSDFTKLQSIDHFDYLYTGKVKSMDYTFNYCSGLESIDVSMLDTHNVISMYKTFYLCLKTNTINIEG